MLRFQEADKAHQENERRGGRLPIDYNISLLVTAREVVDARIALELAVEGRG